MNRSNDGRRTFPTIEKVLAYQQRCARYTGVHSGAVAVPGGYALLHDPMLEPR